CRSRPALRPPHGLLHLPGRGQHRSLVLATGGAGGSLDGAGHGHGRHHGAPAFTHRRAHRRHAPLPLLHALGPALAGGSAPQHGPRRPEGQGQHGPTGTMVRNPWGDSRLTTHTRVSPRRTYSCVLSAVVSRRASKAGTATWSSDRAARREPSTKRPSASRPTSRCFSKAWA